MVTKLNGATLTKFNFEFHADTNGWFFKSLGSNAYMKLSATGNSLVTTKSNGTPLGATYYGTSGGN
jgi:hypothetical protein